MGKKIYGLDLNNIGAESITPKRGVADDLISYINVSDVVYAKDKADADHLYWEYQSNQDYLWEVQLNSGGEGEGRWYTTKLVFAPEVAPSLVYYLVFTEESGYVLYRPNEISNLRARYLIKCQSSENLEL